MPKRTVRASATALPKSNPAEPYPGVALHERFEQRYAAWLKARAVQAANELGQDDDAVSEGTAAADEAARQLLATPPSRPWQVFKKWEVLDLWVNEEAEDGKMTDKRVVAALAIIKAEVMRFGLIEGGEK